MITLKPDEFFIFYFNLKSGKNIFQNVFEAVMLTYLVTDLFFKFLTVI